MVEVRNSQFQGMGHPKYVRISQELVVQVTLELVIMHQALPQTDVCLPKRQECFLQYTIDMRASRPGQLRYGVGRKKAARKKIEALRNGSVAEISEALPPVPAGSSGRRNYAAGGVPG